MKNIFKHNDLAIYSKSNMKLSKIRWDYSVTAICILLSLQFVVGFYTGFSFKLPKNEFYRDGFFVIRPQKDQFSPQKLEEYLKELNVRFLDVVICQSQLETGFYKDNVFTENINLFGMREAKVRPTTAKGTINGHAFYIDWKSSCVDYALWQARFCSKIETEEDYLRYLQAVYAKDKDYMTKLISLIGSRRKNK